MKIKGVMVAIITLLMVVVLPTLSMAVGTVTQSQSSTIDQFDGRTIRARLITMTFTADSGDGTIPSTALNAASLAGVKGWYLYYVVTSPGTTAPTNAYSITVTDENGVDVLGGKGASAQSNTAAVKTWAYPTSGGFSPVTGSLTVTITGNSVHSATGTVILVFMP